MSKKLQPALGRQFPLRLGEIRRAARSAKLVNAYGRPILIRHMNVATPSPLGIPLLELFPGDALTVYSVPESVSPGLAAEAVRVAIPALSRQKAGHWRFDQSRSFKAVLDTSEKCVRIIQQVVRLQKRKYRGDSKFSTAFKKRITSKVDTVVETLLLGEISKVT